MEEEQGFSKEDFGEMEERLDRAKEVSGRVAFEVILSFQEQREALINDPPSTRLQLRLGLVGAGVEQPDLEQLIEIHHIPKLRKYAYLAYDELSESSSVRELTGQIASRDDVEVKSGTVYKWLCSRNPLYNPGGDMDTKYYRLAISVLQIAAFIESP